MQLPVDFHKLCKFKHCFEFLQVDPFGPPALAIANGEAGSSQGAPSISAKP